MAAMAARVPRQPLDARPRRLPAIALLAGGLALAGALALAADPAGTLVRYGFDDENVATGPDTFAVFEKAKGRVRLSTAFRYLLFRWGILKPAIFRA